MEKTVTTLTCDHCGGIITETETYVSAQVWGADFHMSCMDLMTAKQLVVYLHLDEMKIMKYRDWDSSQKADSYYRSEIKLKLSAEYGK